MTILRIYNKNRRRKEDYKEIKYKLILQNMILLFYKHFKEKSENDAESDKSRKWATLGVI